MANDPFNAFVDRTHVAGAAAGPLSGLTFAVKDLFDVAGYPTSGGQPFILALSGIKTRTAPTVQTLLDAGALPFPADAIRDVAMNREATSPPRLR